MSTWYRAGDAIEPVETVDIDDRALHYGDGLFETIAVRDAKPRFWPLHYERLRLGCERLGIVPPGVESLGNAVGAAIDEHPAGSAFATLKIVVSAGSGPRGYRRPATPRTSVWIGVFAAQPLPETSYLDGVRVRLCQTRLGVQPALAGIKSLNRLEQVLARAEWSDDAVFEGIMLDTGGRAICGTMSNVFIVANDTIVTPAITRCGVTGIMRRQVLTALAGAGIHCDVSDVPADRLLAADEVFLTNSQFGVLPIARLDARDLGVGGTTRKVMALMAAAGVTECAP